MLILCSRISATNSGCSETNSVNGIGTAIASLRYRIEVVGMLQLNGTERPMCRSASVERYIPMGEQIYPPSSVANAPASPQGEAFLQDSFRTTQQGRQAKI